MDEFEVAAYPGVIGLFLLDSDVLETNPTKRDVGTPISLAAPFMLNHHNVRLDAVLNCGVSNLSLCDLYSMKEMSPDLDNHKLKSLTDGLTTPVTAVPFSVKPLDSVGIQSSFYLHNVVQDVEIEGHLAVPPAIVISQPSINDRSTSRASKKKAITSVVSSGKQLEIYFICIIKIEFSLCRLFLPT
jgi:hypothetical protein